MAANQNNTPKQGTANDYNTYQLPLFPDTVNVPNTNFNYNCTTYTLYPKTTEQLYWELIQREISDLNAYVNPSTTGGSTEDQAVGVVLRINRLLQLMDTYRDIKGDYNHK
jgi:hypothetical protein